MRPSHLFQRWWLASQNHPVHIALLAFHEAHQQLLEYADTTDKPIEGVVEAADLADAAITWLEGALAGSLTSRASLEVASIPRMTNTAHSANSHLGHSAPASPVDAVIVP